MTDFYNLVPSAPKGRFDGITRPYSAEDVKRLRGSVEIRHSLAEMGANRLWQLIHQEDFVNALAGFHQLNFGMFELARGYKDRQMAAYSELQEAEFAAEVNGYTATKHQREVGTGYFDAVSMAITGGQSSTTAMKESTEHDQFRPAAE